RSRGRAGPRFHPGFGDRRAGHRVASRMALRARGPGAAIPPCRRERVQPAEPEGGPRGAGARRGAREGGAMKVLIGLLVFGLAACLLGIGLGAIGLVYRLTAVAGRRLDAWILVLAGVVVSAFTGALMSAVLTLSTAEQLRNAFLWLLGSFSGASWQTVVIFSAYAASPLAALFASPRALDLLSLGEEPARALGLDA